MNYWS